VEPETTYTVEEAAAVLRETPERVVEMLRTGELDGIPPGATLSGEWKVLLQTSLMEDPGPEGRAEEAPENTTGVQGEDQTAGGASQEFVQPPRSATEAAETLAESKESSRGGHTAANQDLTAPSGWVSTQQAARALGISPRTVRWHIEQGNLEAKLEGEGIKRHWLVSIDSLQAYRNTRQTTAEVPRGYRDPPEIAAESSGEAIRVLAERLEDAAARAAEYRVRLELTEQAASSVQTELAEERRRREAAERERDALRRKLQAVKERPREARESPVSRGPTDTPTAPPRGSQESREATQSAAETLKAPDPRPATTPGPQPSPRWFSLAGRVRDRLWRRVFGG